MHRVSFPWMFDVLSAIDALERIEAGKPLLNSWWQLYSAQQQLEALFNQSIYSPYLRISREKANTLHATLTSLAKDAPPDDKKQLTEPEAWTVKFQKSQFRCQTALKIDPRSASNIDP